MDEGELLCFIQNELNNIDGHPCNATVEENVIYITFETGESYMLTLERMRDEVADG